MLHRSRVRTTPSPIVLSLKKVATIGATCRRALSLPTAATRSLGSLAPSSLANRTLRASRANGLLRTWMTLRRCFAATRIRSRSIEFASPRPTMWKSSAITQCRMDLIATKCTPVLQTDPFLKTFNVAVSGCSLHTLPLRYGSRFGWSRSLAIAVHDITVERPVRMTPQTQVEVHTNLNASIGARSVTFKPGKNAPRGCSIGVYSIGFHCASSIVPTVSSTLYTLTSYDMASSSSWSMARCRDGSCHTSAARSGPVPAPSASVQACPGGHCPATGPVVTSHVSGGSLSTTSFVQNVSISPMSASLSSCHASLCPSSMPWENARTSYPEQSSGCYGSTCSVRASATASYHSLNSGTRSTSADSTSMVVPGPASVQTSYLASNCPDLLPRCLNTWITMSECMNNSDSNCFCGKESYIENVMGCIGAWSTSDEEADVAASYLMGICTAHVPANPAIITAYSLPSQLGPLRATHTVAASRTTITFTAILIVALTQSTGTCAGLPIPGSSYTAQLVKTVTVPAFQRATSTITIAGHTTACVGLGAGTASSVTAHSTGAASSTSMASHPRVIASGGLYGTVNRTASATGLTATNAKSSLFISPVIGGGQKVVFEFINLAVGALAALAVL